MSAHWARVRARADMATHRPLGPPASRPRLPHSIAHRLTGGLVMPHCIEGQVHRVAKRVGTRTLIVVLVVLFGLAWSEASAVQAIDPPLGLSLPAAPLRKLSTAQPSADLVVLVSLDGLRPDVITPDMRALHRLYLQGVSPHTARTIDKSATLPSHASMVSGVDESQHGLNFNAYRPDRAAIGRPTVFSVAHLAGL